MLVCVLVRVFCLCPIFLVVLVHDAWILNYLDVVEAVDQLVAESEGEAATSCSCVFAGSGKSTIDWVLDVF